MEKKLEQILKKYTIYRSNLQWHLDTNKPGEGEVVFFEQRITDFSEIIADLQSLSHSQEQPELKCLDCGLPYKDFGLDTVLSSTQWGDIHTDEQGVLCANCIVKRAEKNGAIIMWAEIQYSHNYKGAQEQNKVDSQEGWISVEDKRKPEFLKPVLAEITHVNDLGLSQWYEVVFYSNGWCSFSGSKTFDDGEKVVRWMGIPS